MIAVLAHEREHPVVREFFELFKTPWEFYRSRSPCDVLICSNHEVPNTFAKLVLICGAEPTSFDRENNIQVRSQRSNAVLSYQADQIPLYGNCLTFDAATHALRHESTQEPSAVEIASQTQTFVRIGFDLFHEISHLLTHGQPPANSGIATLELHIALIRDLIISNSIPLVEIPAVPPGYKFIACLTHDVDHAGIRNHKCDHTMFGFLYRAIVGSLIDFCTGRRSLGQVAANWKAAFSLPLVYLNRAKDFWSRFDRYIEIEKGHASTFFLIPRRGDPGQDGNRPAPSMRAVRYELEEIRDQLQRLLSAGCEIGLHGIDAWCDAAKGRAELERIRSVTGETEVGTRIHWLFFDEESPATLEKAGCSYDSTVGYNETVGYRAGTTQAFKPLGLERMLELPMHVMDTALFYPSYMNLSRKRASAVVGGLIKNATRFGGTLTVNWHDRSIAPERLWADAYAGLLGDLESGGAWFSTGAQAVAWFRKRRSSVIESISHEGNAVRVRVSLNESEASLPGLKIRVHKASPRRANDSQRADTRYVDVAFSHSDELQVAL